MRGFSGPICPAWQLSHVLILNTSLPPEVRLAHGILTGHDLSWREFLLEWSTQYGYESYLHQAMTNNSYPAIALSAIIILLSLALIRFLR